jgi:hypothetical protein
MVVVVVLRLRATKSSSRRRHLLPDIIVLSLNFRRNKRRLTAYIMSAPVIVEM